MPQHPQYRPGNNLIDQVGSKRYHKIRGITEIREIRETRETREIREIRETIVIISSDLPLKGGMLFS